MVILLVFLKQVDKMKSTFLYTEIFFRDFIKHLHKKRICFKCNNFSKDLNAILDNLLLHHYIRAYYANSDTKQTTIYLSYDREGKSVINTLQLISTKNRPQIITLENIKKFLKLYPTTLFLVRTQTGIKSSKECAVLGYGGHLIAIVS